MAEDEMLACPFCAGKATMHRSEIVARLSDPNLPQKIAAELQRAYEQARAEEEQEPAMAGSRTSKADFLSEVHSWTNHWLWRRSAKE